MQASTRSIQIGFLSECHIKQRTVTVPKANTGTLSWGGVYITDVMTSSAVNKELGFIP